MLGHDEVERGEEREAYIKSKETKINWRHGETKGPIRKKRSSE